MSFKQSSAYPICVLYTCCNTKLVNCIGSSFFHYIQYMYSSIWPFFGLGGSKFNQHPSLTHQPHRGWQEIKDGENISHDSKQPIRCLWVAMETIRHVVWFLHLVKDDSQRAAQSTFFSTLNSQLIEIGWERMKKLRPKTKEACTVIYGVWGLQQISTVNSLNSQQQHQVSELGKDMKLV